MSYTPDPAAVAFIAGLLSTIDFPPSLTHPVLMEPMAEAVIVALVEEGHMVDDATYTTCVQSLTGAVALLRQFAGINSGGWVPMKLRYEAKEFVDKLATQGGPDAE